MTIGFGLSSGNDAMIPKPSSIVASWFCDAEPDVAVDERRPSLGVERHEVDRRADLAGREVGAAQLVLVEVARELAAVAGGVGAADLRRRQRPPHAVDGVVVQLAELLGRAAPVADVGLVPGLPVPGLDLGLAVLLDAVLRPLVDQVAPLLVVLRGVGPAGVDLVVLRGRRPRVLVGLAASPTSPAA